MADIDVVPKKPSLAWLWILIAVVAAVILWAMMSGNQGTGQAGQVARPIVFASAPSSAAVTP